MIILPLSYVGSSVVNRMFKHPLQSIPMHMGIVQDRGQDCPLQPKNHISLYRLEYTTTP
jgi:hypothetical protein